MTDQETRLRTVELSVARLEPVVEQLPAQMREMKADLLRAIDENRPAKTTSASWVMVAVAVAAIVLSPILTALMTR